MTPARLAATLCSLALAVGAPTVWAQPAPDDAAPAEAEPADPDAPADESAAGTDPDTALIAADSEPDDESAAAESADAAEPADGAQLAAAPTDDDSPLLEASRGRWPWNRIEAGAFLGGNYFSDQIELGNAFFTDQVPGSAFLLGGRAAWRVGALFRHDTLDPQLLVEAETKLALAATPGSQAGMRDSFFTPVLGWRLHAMVAILPDAPVQPFAVLGIGGETVFSSSPFMSSTDTDSALHWGVGARYPLARGYAIRADLRHGLTAGRDQAVSHTLELHVGFAYRFGRGAPARAEPAVAERAPTPPRQPAGGDDDDDDAADADGDGIPDRVDLCPAQAELPNGIEDDDGCPELDLDHDGLLGEHDECPNDAEDFDGFEDHDGCPEPDNDGDGRPDVIDACPAEPETLNGFEDGDGCADEVPPFLSALTGVLRGVQFESGRARIDGPSAALDDLARVLARHASVKLRIHGYTDDRGDPAANTKLSQDRAQAVVQYLVDRGIAADRLEALGHGADKPIASNGSRAGRAKNRRIELELVHGPASIPAPM